MLDALCQGIESWWSINSTDESKEYSKIAIETIMNNWEQYIFEDDEQAAEQIMVGSNYAGKAINITQTTAPHAFSYKLTSLYGIPHGHAVAICLPVIWEFMLSQEGMCNDPRGCKYLSGIFEQIANAMKVISSIQAIKLIKQMMSDMELQQYVQCRSEEEMCILTSSVNPIRLRNNPVSISSNEIRNLYEFIARR